MRISVISLIPARAGSKGVPQKNIRWLKGFPLIAYSIAASKLTQKIKRTVVSTDSKEIASIARRFGADVPFLRPAQYARDSSPDIEFVQHAMDWFLYQEKIQVDYLVHLRPTTPLRDPRLIDNAIGQFKENKNATSLRSAHPASESPCKWFRKNSKGFFVSFMDHLSLDECNLPRQQFVDAFVPDGYVDVLKVNFLKKSMKAKGEPMVNPLYGQQMMSFISPVCTEVDTKEDLEYLKYQLEKKGSILYDFLKKNFKKE